MGKRLLKEIIIFTVLLVILAVMQHSDLTSDPAARFETMATMGNYSHPFLWTAVVYLLLAGLRGFMGLIIRTTKSDKEK